MAKGDNEVPWEGMFEGIFGPRLPKGVAYGGKKHYRWDMRRAHRWAKETLGEYERKQAEIAKALEALRKIAGEDEPFDEWKARIDAAKVDREEGHRQWEEGNRRKREERLALIAAYRETDAETRSGVTPPAVTTLEELAAWILKIADVDREHLPAELRLACWQWEHGPERLTDEQRAAGCGYCNGGERFFATFCLEHAWSKIAAPYVDACEICGRLYVRKQEKVERYISHRPSGERWVVPPSICDDLCRSVARSERARAVRAANRNGLACEVCGEIIDAGRSDARYCSTACRQKAYRERRRSR